MPGQWLGNYWAFWCCWGNKCERKESPNRRLTGRSQSRKDLVAGLRTGWRPPSLSQGEAPPIKAISKKAWLESRAAENIANRYPTPSKLKSCHSSTARYSSYFWFHLSANVIKLNLLLFNRLFLEKESWLREKELDVVSQKAFPGIERSHIRGVQSLRLGPDDKSWIPQPVCGPHEPAPSQWGWEGSRHWSGDGDGIKLRDMPWGLGFKLNTG